MHIVTDWQTIVINQPIHLNNSKIIPIERIEKEIGKKLMCIPWGYVF